jgi:hypothetical protein
MAVAVTVYSVLLLVGVLAMLAAAGQFARDEWRHRTQDGRALAARLTSGTPGVAATTTGRRMRVDPGLVLAAYGGAFAGDLMARSIVTGWDPAASAQWTVPNAFIAAGVHVLLDRNTPDTWWGRRALRSEALIWGLAFVLGILGGITGA